MKEQFLRMLVKAGIGRRFPGGISEEYARRLDNEIKVITEKGLIQYHIVMAEITEYIRLLGYVPEECTDNLPNNSEDLGSLISENKWKRRCMTIGIGKGKICGSLLCFVLGITDVDPVKYGLVFEQYINNPNASLDIAPSIAGRGMDFLEKKFGKEQLIDQTNDERPSFTIKCCKDDSDTELRVTFELFDTLDYINEAIRTEKLPLRPDEIRSLSFSNDLIYRDIFAGGKTNRVFIFSQPEVKAAAMEFEPKTINDLAIILSVTRPGIEDNLEKILRNKRENIYYIIPELESILRETYGIIVFQEQIVEICMKIAGLTTNNAELMRKKLCKKRDYEGNREIFVTSCKKNGVKTNAAVALFGKMYDSASMSFNKSHAIPYAMYAYITAWIDRIKH